METILITGGTGNIGRVLIKRALAKGYNVVVLTRDTGKKIPGAALRKWDPDHKEIDSQALKDVDHIIHLAGAGIFDKRWTKAYKKEIVDSRVNSTALLLTALEGKAHKVKTFVSASAIGWYGPDKTKSHRYKETEPADASFLGEVCRQWEEAAYKADAMNIRTACVRTGIVLAPDDGIYEEINSKIKLGIAPIFWPGDQVMSWVHIEDLADMYLHLIENEKLSGSYNAVADLPVSNKEFVIQTAKIEKGNFALRVHIPGFMLKLLLGEASAELLSSCTVSNEKIKQSGYSCVYPSIESALRHLHKARNAEKRTNAEK